MLVYLELPIDYGHLSLPLEHSMFAYTMPTKAYNQFLHLRHVQRRHEWQYTQSCLRSVVPNLWDVRTKVLSVHILVFFRDCSKSERLFFDYVHIPACRSALHAEISWTCTERIVRRNHVRHKVDTTF